MISVLMLAEMVFLLEPAFKGILTPLERLGLRHYTLILYMSKKRVKKLRIILHINCQCYTGRVIILHRALGVEYIKRYANE